MPNILLKMSTPTSTDYVSRGARLSLFLGIELARAARRQAYNRVQYPYVSGTSSPDLTTPLNSEQTYNIFSKIRKPILLESEEESEGLRIVHQECLTSEVEIAIFLKMTFLDKT